MEERTDVETISHSTTSIFCTPHTMADLKDGPQGSAGKSITNAKLRFSHPGPDPNMWTKDPAVGHPQPPEITAGESWAERSPGTTVRAKCVLYDWVGRMEVHFTCPP